MIFCGILSHTHALHTHYHTQTIVSMVRVYILHLIWLSLAPIKGNKRRGWKNLTMEAWPYASCESGGSLAAVLSSDYTLMAALSLSLSLSLCIPLFALPFCLLSCDEVKFSFSVSIHIALSPDPFPAIQCSSMQYWKAGNGDRLKKCSFRAKIFFATPQSTTIATSSGQWVSEFL